MDKEERISACYLHGCLKYVNREPMNNTSLRERLGVEEKNSAMVSRIIKQAINVGVIRPYDSDPGTKAMRYIPFGLNNLLDRCLTGIWVCRRSLPVTP